jgi:hypothetical protein
MSTTTKTIYVNIATTLKRADEVLAELLAEYEKSLKAKEVSSKAMQLTHDLCTLCKSALDRIARRYWDLHVSPQLTEDERTKATIYFPAAEDQHGFDSTLGRWQWKSVRADHQPVYEYLLAQQPFSSGVNRWLGVISDLSVQGKHIDLVPQKRTEQKRTTVERAGGAVSWNPDAVRFGGGVRIMGAPVNPATQQVAPTSDMTVRHETWVNFLIDGHNVNAAGLCKEACAQTRRIVEEMTDMFELS